MNAPLYYSWDGDSLRPLPRFADRARKQFTIGEKYRMVEEHERSVQSHNHFFSCVAEAWRNLPHNLADRFPSETHLRKWALVRAGYADERSILASSPEEAERIGAFVRPSDPYAVIIVNDCLVRVYTAQSQSKKAMGAKEFNSSKQAVLDIISQLIGISSEELTKNSGKAA